MDKWSTVKHSLATVNRNQALSTIDADGTWSSMSLPTTRTTQAIKKTYTLTIDL